MPHIQEVVNSAIDRRAPGFAWVADTGYDPSKVPLGTANKKRARQSVAQEQRQLENATARQKKQIESRLKELNKDSTRDVQIALPKREGGAGGGRAGKTPNTKKILSSGKDFFNYLDDEEAELARRKGNGPEKETETQRASKTPIARRKHQQAMRDSPSASGSPAPSAMAMGALPLPRPLVSASADDMNVDGGDEASAVVLEASLQALLDAPPLSYNQARSAPPPAAAAPQRTFCEMCGYWGRVRCMKCGARVCGMECKDAHEAERCLRFYA